MFCGNAQSKTYLVNVDNTIDLFKMYIRIYTTVPLAYIFESINIKKITF